MSDARPVSDKEAKLDDARHAIRAQIEERNAHYADQAPMFPWDRAGRAMSYVFDLPPHQLRSIRLHCDVFLGTQSGNTLYMDINRGGYGWIEDLWRWLGEGVDSKLWAEEPPIPCLQSGFGLSIDGRCVNDVTCDVQRYVCNLLRLGLRDGQRVVEIGAGYGGLAHAVLKARDVRYCIIDLPETLIYSASFLIEHFPDAEVYVYRPGDAPSAMGDAKIAFLPNYRADWIGETDVAINTVSFPEMSRDALTGYLRILSERLTPEGFLVSVNYYGDRGDGRGVADFIMEYFDLTPSPDTVMKVTGKSFEQYRHINFRPTLVATRRGVRAPTATFREFLSGERFEISTDAAG